jgi:transcriptional regulator with XRE-family HTH domain
MAETKQPKPVDVHVGEAVRALRKLRHISQEGLAAKLGVSFQQVQKYEKGTNRVSCSTLVAMGEALNCAPADLLPPREGSTPAHATVTQMLGATGGVEVAQAFLAMNREAQQAFLQVAAILRTSSRAKDVSDAYRKAMAS